MDNVELDQESQIGRNVGANETAMLTSLKQDRRTLVKFGRMSGMRVTRFYVLHNDILMYYKSRNQSKSKSSQSLFKCFFERDTSKIKGFSFSLKVITSSSNKQKVFWLHPLKNEEFEVLQRYISFASEGKFSSDHIMIQIVHPINSKKQIRGDSLCMNHQQLLSKKTTALDSVALISQPRPILTRNSQINDLEFNDDNGILVPYNNSLLSPRSQLKQLEPFSNNCINEDQPILQLASNTSRLNFHQSTTPAPEIIKDNHEECQLKGNMIEEKHDFKNEGKSKHHCNFHKSSVTTGSFQNEKGGINLNNQEAQITLAQVSQNNMVSNQLNASVIADKFQNISFGFQNMKESLPASATDRAGYGLDFVKELEQFVSSPPPQNGYFDFDADIQFSSDEEDQKNKNDKLESVKKSARYFSAFTPRCYFNDNDGFQNDKIIYSAKEAYSESSIINQPEIAHQKGGIAEKEQQNCFSTVLGMEPYVLVPSIQFQNSGYQNPTSSTNISIGFQSTSMQIQQVYAGSIFGNVSGTGQGEEGTKQMRSDSSGNLHSIPNQLSAIVQSKGSKNNLNETGPFNLSSLTLQNIQFSDNLNNLPESPHDSFFSQRFESHQHYQSQSQSQLHQPLLIYSNLQQGQQGTHVVSQFSRKRSLFDGASQNRSNHDKEVNEIENATDNESEIGGEGDHHSIKQLAFCAGSIRSFIDEIDKTIRVGDQQLPSDEFNRIDRKSAPFLQVNHPVIGRITDYSFDQPSICDSDLFEEEDGKFKRNFQPNSMIRNTNSDMSSMFNQITSQFAKKVKSNRFKLKKRSHSHEIQIRKVPYELKGQQTTFRSEKGIENSLILSTCVQDPLNTCEIKEKQRSIRSENLLDNLQEGNFSEHSSPIQINNNPSYLSREHQIITPSKQGHLYPDIGQPQYLQIYGQKKVRSKSVNVNLKIDVEVCNEGDVIKSTENLPRIKDKKEFYNKKNAGLFIIPKMEASIDLEEMSSLERAYEMGYFYLWSFQLENAMNIFSVHRETNIGMEYALIEPLLMKIMVSGSRELMSVTEKKIAGFLELVEVCEKDVAKKGNKSNIKCLKSFSKLSIELLKSEAAIVKGFLQSLLGNKFQSFLSFKNAYSWFKKSKAKIVSMTESESMSELDVVTQSRFYFISGVFNIGLAMIPSYFLKILSLLGINPDKKLGYECLEKCIELGSIRSHYASLLLCIEYTELNPNLEKSIKIIKKMIKTIPQCPLFYWMAALLSWRFAKPDEALQLINKSIWNCGEALGQKASYLRFEKGWFCVSQFDWRSALDQFEEISIQCMNIHELEVESIENIASSKKIPLSTARLIDDFIKRAKSSFSPSMKIILPHKCGIALLIACCNQHVGKLLLMDLWFLMTIYLFKQSKSKTLIDEDLAKLTGKYLHRGNKQFIKYEVLYFVKEITKLREDRLTQMVSELSDYYEEHYSNFTIFSSLKGKPQQAVDFGQLLFLRIVGGCLQQQFSVVYSTSAQLEGIQEYIPSDHIYLLHHSHHWIARCYIQQNEFKKAKEHLKKCLKYKKCEFTLENKTQKFLSEIPS